MRNPEKNPLFTAFGRWHKFLAPDDAIGADFETRLRSIWPLMCRRVRGFSGTLTRRERANFDDEDVLAELVVALARKDGLWRPDHGRYITFAWAVIKSELASIRDRSRTVQSPRNSTCRLKAYQAESDAGTLTARRRATFQDIRRTSANPVPVGSSGDDGIVDLVDERGPGGRLPCELAEDAIERAICEALEPLETESIASTAGVFGWKRRANADVAREYGVTEDDVRAARASGMAKVRDFLVSIGHPALRVIGFDE